MSCPPSEESAELRTGRARQGSACGAGDEGGDCGALAAAGKNSNRTSLSDNAGTTITYRYNRGDQLTSSSDAAVGTIAYDGRGSTTTLGNQQLTFDGADRHTRTEPTAGATRPTVNYR